jgi:hypothetical protein
LIAVIKAVAWTDASYMCLIAWYTQHDGLLVRQGPLLLRLAAVLAEGVSGPAG